MQEKVNKALAELIVAAEEVLLSTPGCFMRLEEALAAVNALLFPEKQI